MPTNPTDIQKEADKYFKIKDTGLFIKNLVSNILILASVLCLFYLLWGAITWMTSQGEKAKYEEARNRITAALIGLGLIALSWLIWRLAIYFLGIGVSTNQGVEFQLF